MEQPTTFGKLYGIPQDIEERGVGLEGKCPESQDVTSKVSEILGRTHSSLKAASLA
jgi:hypothetical protein